MEKCREDGFAVILVKHEVAHPWAGGELGEERGVGEGINRRVLCSRTRRSLGDEE